MDRILRQNRIKYILCGVVFAVLLVIVGCVSLCMGAMEISPADIWGGIVNGMGGKSSTPQNITAIVWNIRLPRIICAAAVGSGLAVSGVIFQGILQNPLADPYTLGISTGASFGAALAIVLNLMLGIYFSTVMAALVGAIVTLCAVMAISFRGNGIQSTNLIIAGIIASSVLSAGVSFIKMLAGENVGAIVFWIMGSMSAVSWGDVALVLPVVAICGIISAMLSGRLDIMSLGDDNALALGINTGRLRLVYLMLASVITAVCVASCGVIGFVGLIVPHLLRLWLTARNSVLIPLSALLGALLLLTADSVTRIFSAGEIPVGVLTTLIGGPFFIYIFTRRGGMDNE